MTDVPGPSSARPRTAPPRPQVASPAAPQPSPLSPSPLSAPPLSAPPPDPNQRLGSGGPNVAWLRVGRLSPAALGLLAVAALFGNLALHTGGSSLIAPLAVMTAAGCLWFAESLSSPRSRSMAMAAIAVAWWLPLRDSGWLTWLNTLTAAALLVGAVVFDRHRPPRLSVRSMTQFATRVSAGFAGPFLVVRSLPLGAARRNGTSQRAFEVFRGLAIASVPVVIIGALLVQADALFASVLRIDVNAEAFASHAVISGLVALAIAGVVCVGRSGSGIDYGRPGLLGSIELVTVLASLFVLLGAFGLTQLLSTFADVEAILAAEGTTHAEYARSGFFQLLAVAALMLLLLCALRAVARPTVGVVDRARRALGAGVCLLTLLVVAVSIQRLGLYVEAFGQTTLRWYSTAFAWLLGMTFILFAIEHARAAKVMTAAWLGRATVVLVVATLLAVNAINPERRVANHNLTNEATESALDGWYLTRLSADAWPALLAHLDELTATGDTRIGVPLAVIAERCEHVATQPGWGVAGFNLSRARLACPQWSL